jgi:hypothetical protein
VARELHFDWKNRQAIRRNYYVSPDAIDVVRCKHPRGLGQRKSRNSRKRLRVHHQWKYSKPFDMRCGSRVKH